MICFALISILFPGYSHADPTQWAVVATGSTDGSLNSISRIRERKWGGSRIAEHHLIVSDYRLHVCAYQSHVFVLEEKETNPITRYGIEYPSAPLVRYPGILPGEAGDIHPFSLVFANETRACLLRSGTAKVLVVNPTAPDSTGFILEEIDISSFFPDNNHLNITCGAVAGSLFFFGVDQLDEQGLSLGSSLAVVDAETLEPVDTGYGEAPFGTIPLPVRGITSLHYLGDSHRIYAHAKGNLFPQPDFAGGILGMDPDDFSVWPIIDDGDELNHPFGYIRLMAVISETKAFFAGAATESDNTLFLFNPSTGDTDAVEFNSWDASYMQHKKITGLGVDQHDRLWISNATDNIMVILKTTPDALGRFSSDEDVAIPSSQDGFPMLPKEIAFSYEPDTEEEDEKKKPSSSGESGNFCFIRSLM